MVKWSIELNKYNLKFQLRKSIKAQALIDFVAECSFEKLQEIGQQSVPEIDDQQVIVDKETDIWSVYVDGSSTQEGVGVRILLV